MTMFADLLSTVFERRTRFYGPSVDDPRTTQKLIEELINEDGEMSGRRLGRLILDRFAVMEDSDKAEFFRHLAEDMNFDPNEVRRTLDDYELDPSRKNYRRFVEAAETTRQDLIRRLNRVPQVTGQLVNMRADLLKISKGDPALETLDLDFQNLLSSWFNRGFLVLRPISWESPAHILEKIIAYEAVHAIYSWGDLQRRLEPLDRRCFAFFHPAIPDEPLIFVEVALTKGIPRSIQDLLTDQRDEIVVEDADTAVFYSISNCQAGLASISFGNSLIKQVAADLAAEIPRLKTFVTLSPIPGLNDWMTENELEANAQDADRMLSMAAHYLLTAKRDDGLPRDPVARFHLGNGATIKQLHPGADASDKGVRQSSSVMVSYLYDLAKVSQNYERYATSGTIGTSSEIRSLNATAKKALAKEAV